MKKITSVIILCVSLIILTSAIVFSFIEEGSEYMLIRGEDAEKLDASFEYIYFDEDYKLKNAPLFLFMGIDKNNDKINMIKDANIVIFKNNENAENASSAFIYHYLKLLDDNRNLFTEIRLITVYEEIYLKVFDTLLYFIDYGKLDIKILPNRLTQINKNIIDKNKNNVYNKICNNLIDYGVAIDKYDISANFSKDDLTASLYIFDEVEPLDYYLNLFVEDIPKDNNVANSFGYGLSPILPLSYLKGRMGKTFVLNNEMQKSLDVNDAEICGFVFQDIDLNGYYDAKWDILYEGVKVKAYLTYKGSIKLLSFDTTDKSGYYRLIIPQIYANNFDKIYIETEKISGLKMTFRSNDTFLMNNDINSDFKSDEVVFYSPIELKIINIGYRD